MRYFHMSGGWRYSIDLVFFDRYYFMNALSINMNQINKSEYLFHKRENVALKLK